MTRPSSNDCKILIADDEPVTLRMFQRYLELAGMVTVTARDGKEAIAKMNHDIRVAVLDLNMPGMTGLECMRQLQRVSGDGNPDCFRGWPNLGCGGCDEGWCV